MSHGHQQAGLAALDQLGRAGRGAGDHRLARRPGLDDRVAERLAPRRADQHIGGGEQRADILAPAEEAHAVFDAERRRLALQSRAQGSLAREPEIKPRHFRHRREQHIEAFVRMQPPERHRERRIVGRREAGARQRRQRRRVGEIRQIMHAVRRPAFLHHPFGQRARIADEMMAVLVVAQIVIAAEPRDMHEIAARAIDRRAAHPAQHHARLEIVDRGFEAARGDEIEHAAEGDFIDLEPRCAQSRRALGLAADDEPLRLAGMMQRDRQPLEERLGPAMRRARHRLQDARHDISASKRSATHRRSRPLAGLSAASCCRRHSASLPSNAIACRAKLCSSLGNKAGDAIAGRARAASPRAAPPPARRAPALRRPPCRTSRSRRRDKASRGFGAARR